MCPRHGKSCLLCVAPGFCKASRKYGSSLNNDAKLSCCLPACLLYRSNDEQQQLPAATRRRIFRHLFRQLVAILSPGKSRYSNLSAQQQLQVHCTSEDVSIAQDFQKVLLFCCLISNAPPAERERERELPALLLYRRASRARPCPIKKNI